MESRLSSLAESLSRDEENLSRSLLHDSLPIATGNVRSHADKMLLAATPGAIQTLTTLSQIGAPKDRIAAASKILEKSPATKEAQISFSGGSSLSDSAMSILMNGLSRFLEIAVNLNQVNPIDPDATANTRIITHEESL